MVLHSKIYTPTKSVKVIRLSVEKVSKKTQPYDSANFNFEMKGVFTKYIITISSHASKVR